MSLFASAWRNDHLVSRFGHKLEFFRSSFFHSGLMSSGAVGKFFVMDKLFDSGLQSNFSDICVDSEQVATAPESLAGSGKAD